MYLEIKDLKKSYGEGSSYVKVLKGINTSLDEGKMCVIQGSSGSGKSTLLNCIGGLDLVDSGSVRVDGQEIAGLKPDGEGKYTDLSVFDQESSAHGRPFRDTGNCGTAE